MTRWTLTLVVAVVGLATSVRAQSVASHVPPSVPTDFARGIEIRAEGGAPIVRVVVPDEVYLTATRPDLLDLRVFNAAGDSVPHMLRRAPLPRARDAEAVSVPLFPMYQTASAGRALTQVRIGPGGAVLEVRDGPAAGRAVVAYLADVSALNVPLAGLSLEWESAPGTTFLARVDVQGSDDLNGWRTLVSSTAIARMQHEQYLLTQSDVDLSGARTRYLRLSWPRELASVTLKAVRVRPQSAAPTAEIRWTTLTGRVGDDPPGAAEYDAGGQLPVARVDIEFADPSDVALVSVRSRPEASSPWRSIHAGMFYVLTASGNRVGSTPAPVAPTTDRYWRVETARDGGWRTGRLPRLKLGWYPHELLFLGQGAGPYTLAYGSARASTASAPIDALLTSLGSDGSAVEDDRIGPGTTGVPHDLGGTQVLRPARPWKQIALWAVLVVAVVALAGLAFRVSRDTVRG